MRALQFQAFGDPDDVLKLVELPDPVPGPGEVLIRITHRSINPSDVLTVRGSYATRLKPPAVPGYEGVGVVEALGEGVTQPAIGTRVIPLGIAGTWGQKLVAPAAALVPVPDNVPDSSAAQFVVNPLTAYVMVFDVLAAKPGDWVIQSAGGSTLGRVLIQMAREKGIHLISVVRRKDAVEELKRSTGAEHVIANESEAIAPQVQRILGKTPLTRAIDPVSGQTGAQLLDALGKGGTLLVYGRLDTSPIPVEAGPFLFKGLTMKGFWLSEWMGSAAPADFGRVTKAVLGLMAEGKIVPPVEASFDLTQAHEAIRRSEAQGKAGKVLLTG